MASYRALIVDDEPLAREGIRDLLAGDPEVTVCALCKNGYEAVEAVRQWHPDVLFLDVQMPEMDGFAVLKQLGTDAPRVTILVTAYDQYALQAFDVEAVDYLLKPFDAARFHAAVRRAKTRLAQQQFGELNDKLTRLLHRIEKGRPSASHPVASAPTAHNPAVSASPYLDSLVVRSVGTITLVRVEEVDWIEAAGYYVHLHCGPEQHLLRDSLTALERKLDPRHFIRVHRSSIINIGRIKQIKTHRNGQCRIVLRNGEVLPVSRSRSEALKALFAS